MFCLLAVVELIFDGFVQVVTGPRSALLAIVSADMVCSGQQKKPASAAVAKLNIESTGKSRMDIVLLHPDAPLAIAVPYLPSLQSILAQ